MKLNRKGLEFGKTLVSEGKVVRDERDAWSEDQPSAEEENEFIRVHGYEAYAKWHLGIDEEHPEDTKGRYKFPFRGFQESASLRGAVRGEAGQYQYNDIELAAAHLHEMMEGKKHKARGA